MESCLTTITNTRGKRQVKTKTIMNKNDRVFIYLFEGGWVMVRRMVVVVVAAAEVAVVVLMTSFAPSPTTTSICGSAVRGERSAALLIV